MGGLNVKLESLLLDSAVSAKWKYEIANIFYALDTERQLKLLENFEVLLDRIEIIEEEHKRHQEFLIDESMDKMDAIIDKYKDN